MTITKDQEKLVVMRAEWMKKNGLSVRKVADSVGLEYNTVCRWFSYGNTPRKLYLDVMIARYQDWPVEINHAGNKTRAIMGREVNESRNPRVFIRRSAMRK